MPRDEAQPADGDVAAEDHITDARSRPLPLDEMLHDTFQLELEDDGDEGADCQLRFPQDEGDREYQKKSHDQIPELLEHPHAPIEPLREVVHFPEDPALQSTHLAAVCDEPAEDDQRQSSH